jgi:hypothetical protein
MVNKVSPPKYKGKEIEDPAEEPEIKEESAETARITALLNKKLK